MFICCSDGDLRSFSFDNNSSLLDTDVNPGPNIIFPVKISVGGLFPRDEISAKNRLYLSASTLGDVAYPYF